ncbi:MAG TPA: sulfatase-like hydrolase/transferase [Verrucomicrobiae bacterium]|nr:sulfatase-like hydrolase/transferase [Verrucomicrobiae bacterium]
MPDEKSPTKSQPAADPAADAAASRKRQLKDALLCMSLANLCFIPAWFEVLFESDCGYFNRTPVSATTLVALLLNLGGAALLFWLGAQWFRRRGGRALRFVADAALCLLLLVPLNFVRINYFEVAGTAVAVLAKKPAAMLLGLVVVGLFSYWHQFWGRLARVVLGIFLPLTAFSLVQIGLAWIRLANSEATRPVPNPALQYRAAPDQSRVVWIIFDEMDRRLAFDERPTGIALPELDRLRRESLDATNAFSPAGRTLLALPSLITGRTVASAAPASASDLNIVWQDNQERTTWGSRSNIFTRARALGLNTAIVGWYHPYGRVLATSASRIEWMPAAGSEQARASGLGKTMRYQIGAMLPFLHTRRLTVEFVHGLLANAQEVAADTNTHLAFLHLPLPHKPGIYRPSTGKLTAFNFSTRGGYFDNLALCDRVLGELRRAIAEAGLGDRTWLLVSSDHWWRESRFSDGKTDLRVPFLLKSPFDDKPITLGAPFSTVVSQDLLLAILRGEVRDHQGAFAWLERNRVPPPKSYSRVGGPL